MNTTLTHPAPRRLTVQNLLASFLDGRSPSTLTAYSRDLDDFARFLTGSRQETLRPVLSPSLPRRPMVTCSATATNSWLGTWHQPPLTADSRSRSAARRASGIAASALLMPGIAE